MAALNMFQVTDMTLIDKQDYDPQLHQKPLAWEDLRAGELVVVTVIGFVAVAIKANVVLGITSGITDGGASKP